MSTLSASTVTLHDVGDHAWSFVELHDRIDIGRIVSKRGVGRLIHDGVGVEAAPAADAASIRAEWTDSADTPTWDRRTDNHSILHRGSTSSWRLAASQKGLVNSGLMGLGRGLLCSVAIVVFSSLPSGLGAQYERAHHARGPASTVDHAQVVIEPPGALQPGP